MLSAEQVDAKALGLRDHAVKDVGLVDANQQRAWRGAHRGHRCGGHPVPNALMRSRDEAHGAGEPAHGIFKILLKGRFKLIKRFVFDMVMAQSNLSCTYKKMRISSEVFRFLHLGCAESFQKLDPTMN